MVNIRPIYFSIPILLALLAAIFEAVGIGLLVPLLNGFLVEDYTFVKETPVLKDVLEYLPEFISARDRSLFIFLISIFVVAIVLRNVLRFLSNIGLSFLTLRALHHLRKLLFARYLSFGKLFFDRTTVGHHATVLSEFTQLAFFPLLKAGNVINALCSLAAYAVVLVVISWKLTLLVVPLFFLLHIIIQFLVTRIRQHSQIFSERSKDLGKKVVEILMAIPLVKMSTTEEEEREHYTDISDKQADAQLRISIYQQLVSPLQEIITLFFALVIFGAMLYLLVLKDESTAPAFIVYFYVLLNSATKLNMLNQFRSFVAKASGPVNDIMEVLQDEGKEIISSGGEEFTGLRDAIEFKDLHFAYTGEVSILQDLCLAFKKGKMTAIVGPTGAGKTTIIHLITRYYDVSAGMLFVDGRDIREYSTESLCKHVGLVSQDTFLFNESLKKNLVYGLNDISEKQLQKAIEQARLSEFVAELPDGLETLIGDRGVQLSGGEKQRVSIARALLKDADILILDEATSALDSDTEELIQQAIEEVVKDKTTIVIAHRLSTIKNADHIAVIENGRCVEQGSLEELLDAKGRFSDYWEKQQFT